MDKVLISGLKVTTIVGTLDWERQQKQTLLIDIVIETNISKAASTDDIAYAIDYSDVASKLDKLLADSEYFLIEAVAENCARLILQNYGVDAVSITVTKPEAIPFASGVAVSIRRSQRDLTA